MIIKKNKVLSVFLAGGLSKRFGGNTKTLAKINDISIFEKIITFIKKQKTKIIINTNSEEGVFLNSKLPIIRDKNLYFQGPLAGIYSAMCWVKEKKIDIEWILSIPSDTPFLPENLLDIFISNNNNNKQILIARYNNKIHPVVGMWNLSLFHSLQSELKSDNRKIMNWVYKNEFKFVDFPVKNYDPFFNINKKEDLAEAENIDKIIKQSCE